MIMIQPVSPPAQPPSAATGKPAPAHKKKKGGK
jgi:hypothetical protein